jgi:hypothetical protein
MLGSSDSDLNSVKCKINSNNSIDDVAVTTILVNDDDDEDAQMASAEIFKKEDTSNCEGQRKQRTRSQSHRDEAICAPIMGTGRTQYIDVRILIWVPVYIVLRITTPNSIFKVL